MTWLQLAATLPGDTLVQRLTGRTCRVERLTPKGAHLVPLQPQRWSKGFRQGFHVDSKEIVEFWQRSYGDRNGQR